MPKGTTLRNVRIPDEVWDAAKAKAETEFPVTRGKAGGGISEVVRRALIEYVTPPPPTGERPREP